MSLGANLLSILYQVIFYCYLGKNKESLTNISLQCNRLIVLEAFFVIQKFSFCKKHRGYYKTELIIREL